MSKLWNTRPIPPLSTLGVLGGGQLGRMTALAARAAGYRVRALDPNPDCAIGPVVDQLLVAGWDDQGAAAELAKASDVVTFEIEKVTLGALSACQKYAPVRPSPEILQIIQNRYRQKLWLQREGFPIGEFRHVRNAYELQQAATEFAGCFVKATEGGYDGRSQIHLRDAGASEQAWRDLGCADVIAEKPLALACEISVLVARRPEGETCVYAPAMNHHRDQILAWSILPAPIDPALAERAQEIARQIAGSLLLEGILVVEMFVTKQGELLVNELAPRPHNSYHASERACITGQFEQLVRSICNLPLGSAGVVRPTAIVNLLGNLWTQDGPPDFSSALAVPEAKVHLYDKPDVRPGRKMGHISASGETPQEALRHAFLAMEKLTAGWGPPETDGLAQLSGIVEMKSV